MNPDPARSKEHVLLSLLAERRMRGGQIADLAALIADLNKSARRDRRRAAD
jgi:hypothetical protein